MHRYQTEFYLHTMWVKWGAHCVAVTPNQCVLELHHLTHSHNTVTDLIKNAIQLISLLAVSICCALSSVFSNISGSTDMKSSTRLSTPYDTKFHVK